MNAAGPDWEGQLIGAPLQVMPASRTAPSQAPCRQDNRRAISDLDADRDWPQVRPGCQRTSDGHSADHRAGFVFLGG